MFVRKKLAGLGEGRKIFEKFEKELTGGKWYFTFCKMQNTIVLLKRDRRQNTEHRRQKAEGRRQKTEDRRQESEKQKDRPTSRQPMANSYT